MGLDLSKYQLATAGQKKSVAKKESAWADILQKDIKFTSDRLSDRQKEAFYIELHTMVSSGVELKAALDLIEQEQKKEKHAKIIRDIKENLVRGESFSNALKLSGQFTSYEYFSVQIGEETGMLTAVLEQLASYFTKKLKQRRQFINALSYPIVIMFTSIGAVAFMLAFIVPMFTDIFKRFGGELPSLTVAIISVSRFLNDYFLPMALAAAIAFFALWMNRKKTWFRKLSADALGRAPMLGGIYTGIYMARFCNSMALLMSARVPLIRGIQLVRQMIDYYPLEASLLQVEKDILDGKSLHKSLSAFKIFAPRMIALLKVGEEVNRLDSFFKKLADQYSEEVEHKTGLFSAFLEPFMIIFLGAVVGFILIAMYLPMFRLSTSIGG